MIIHTCAEYSINPLLMLSKLVQDQNDVSHIMKSDEELRLSIRLFANSLSHYAHEFDTVNTKAEISTFEYSLRKTFKNDDGLINDFLTICETISQEFDISGQTGTTDPFDQHQISKREKAESIQLELPYANTECWQLGKRDKYQGQEAAPTLFCPNPIFSKST